MRNRIETLFSPVVREVAPPILHDPFEELLSAFFSPSSRARRLGIELHDQKGYYEVVAEVPGFEKEELNVKVEGGTLVIRGKSKKENRERTISQAIYLPEDADSETVKAELKNGILRVTISKLESAKGRDIPIE